MDFGRRGTLVSLAIHHYWPCNILNINVLAVCRCFYIVSDMNGKVLDIHSGSSKPGAKVIVWPKKLGCDNINQLWYFDGNGIILSAMNHYALTARS